MVRPRRTARKSTGRMPVGQLAPRDVPPQQEQQHVPQEEEPFEVELVAPEGQEPQGAPAEEQQLPQNNDNNDDRDDENHDNNNDEEYTPLSDSEYEKMYRDADEFESFGNEAPIPTGRLRDLLRHVGINTAPRFRIKKVPRPGRVEYRAIVEVFHGSSVVSRHTGPAFRASCSDAVADAAWQAITTWNRTHHRELKNSIYHILPQRKKDRFKASGVKTDIPRMEMVHHQDVMVELSIRLQVAQREIQSLRNQLRNSDATLRGYQRMVEGQASHLYASDTDTWSATSTAQGSDDEPPVDDHSPSSSRTR